MKQLIGVDIGGTKVAVGLIQPDGQIRADCYAPSIPNDSEVMYQVVVNSIEQVLTQTHLTQEDVLIGVGVPGIVDQQQGIAIFQNNLSWSNFHLKDRLHHTFPKVERIIVDNDVIQAGLAEWRASGLTQQDIMIFLTISTGIPSPIFFGGEPLRGMGAAGEIGLLPVRTQQRQSLAPLEKVASGPAIAKAGQLLFKDSELTTADVFNLFKSGNIGARQIIEECVDSLSHGIYALTSILNPQKIILGGSVISHNPELLDMLRISLKKEATPYQATSFETLSLSRYNNKAGLIGAAFSVEN